MSLLFFYLLLLFLLPFPLPSLSANNATVVPFFAPCPLNITVLHVVVGGAAFRPSVDSGTRCQYIRLALRLVLSDYLRRTGFFLPPLNSFDSCWYGLLTFIQDNAPNLNYNSCGFDTSWIPQGCMNITTRQQFEASVPNSALQDVHANCNESLENASSCALCTRSLSNLSASYLTGPSFRNLSNCTSYPSIYAAAVANRYGPSDRGTVNCLFLPDFILLGSSGKKRRNLIVVLVSIVCGLVLIIAGFWAYWRLKGRKIIMGKKNISRTDTGLGLGSGSGLDPMSRSTTLSRFTFDEIKEATKNFSGENIIGIGGYGNVYKGVLSDGTQVALKRFKNCSAAGDASFTHEVEVIASIRHVNLVALRGYCTATTNLEGHQRIIVCDLMQNGSLHDHLFGPNGKKLSWPIRQQIALGTAKGLAYLHYGAQPSIIHRDIKASNILLDEKFEAKVADFGLAKFIPEGMTHISTRVAGTVGYVAPEYALYGQLTERSDVFSFGVVLLELLSGKKALQMDSDGQPSALTDLAWSLVRTGRALDVIEEGMPEPGSPQVLEKYVLVAVLCSHPVLYARPTMDQVAKMLEIDGSALLIVDQHRPIPFIAEKIEIGRSVSSIGLGQLPSPTCCQAYILGSDCPSSNSKEEEEGSSRFRVVSID